jgi:hypothetical protein
MSDRRVYDRFDIEGSAVVRDERLRETVNVFVQNISFGGICLRSAVSFPEQSILIFDLSLGDFERPLHVRGLVRHQRRCAPDRPSECELGVEFLDIDRDNLVYLLGRMQNRALSSGYRRDNSRPIDFIPY